LALPGGGSVSRARGRARGVLAGGTGRRHEDAVYDRDGTTWCCHTIR